ncbi:hypothetical protein PUN28_014382 [Cardiocondyla obscurior]|uniref:Transmembrane protein n=1 Tax=Cardiocondyla obscurior TaxID=286306 RepID=A0AAW2F373_9HYME
MHFERNRGVNDTLKTDGMRTPSLHKQQLQTQMGCIPRRLNVLNSENLLRRRCNMWQRFITTRYIYFYLSFYYILFIYSFCVFFLLLDYENFFRSYPKVTVNYNPFVQRGNYLNGLNNSKSMKRARFRNSILNEFLIA